MRDNLNPERGFAPSRRSVIKGIAAAITVGALPTGAYAALPQPVAEFLTLSSRLTGIELDRSYTQLAEVLMQLLSLGDHARIGDLARELAANPGWEQKSPGGRHEATAQAILIAWYNGTVEILPKDLSDPTVIRLFGDLSAQADPAQPGQPVTVLVNYDEAVVWRACDFTKPSATCGGPFGYWQDPA